MLSIANEFFEYFFNVKLKYFHARNSFISVTKESRGKIAFYLKYIIILKKKIVGFIKLARALV